LARCGVLQGIERAIKAAAVLPDQLRCDLLGRARAARAALPWSIDRLTADGTQVLTAARDGIARLRHIALNDTVADLCSRVQRDLTPEERAQYGIPDDGPTCPGQ
jgi:hypothetical protein